MRRGVVDAWGRRGLEWRPEPAAAARRGRALASAGEGDGGARARPRRRRRPIAGVEQRMPVSVAAISVQ